MRRANPLLHRNRERRLENVVAVVERLDDDVVLARAQTYVCVDRIIWVTLRPIRNHAGRAVNDHAAETQWTVRTGSVGHKIYRRTYSCIVRWRRHRYSARLNPDADWSFFRAAAVIPLLNHGVINPGLESNCRVQLSAGRGVGQHTRRGINPHRRHARFTAGSRGRNVMHWQRVVNSVRRRTYDHRWRSWGLREIHFSNPRFFCRIFPRGPRGKIRKGLVRIHHGRTGVHESQIHLTFAIAGNGAVTTRDSVWIRVIVG